MRGKPYTAEQIEFLQTVAPYRSVGIMTMAFNCVFDQSVTVNGIKGTMQRYGIKTGRTGRFEKGNVPHNKGVNGWQAGGKSATTRFRKGQRGSKWVPVGSERKSKDGILQRKMTDTGHPPEDWKSVHGMLWEQHHGPVPDGHIVVFRDGNTGNIRIDNLELISRAENMRRNSIHNLPEPLKDVIRIRGVLTRRINERIRANEKQD